MAMKLCLSIIQQFRCFVNIFDQTGLHHCKGNRTLFCKPFKKPRNLFPAWRAGATTLFDVPAPAWLHTVGWRIPFLGIDAWALNVYNFRLGTSICLQLSGQHNTNAS
jgi:hypothetical protein